MRGFKEPVTPTEGGQQSTAGGEQPRGRHHRGLPCVYVHVCARVCECVCMRIVMCIYACIPACVCTCVNICVCIVCMYVCIPACLCIHVCACAFTHTKHEFPFLKRGGSPAHLGGCVSWSSPVPAVGGAEGVAGSTCHRSGLRRHIFFSPTPFTEKPAPEGPPWPGLSVSQSSFSTTPRRGFVPMHLGALGGAVTPSGTSTRGHSSRRRGPCWHRVRTELWGSGSTHGALSDRWRREPPLLGASSPLPMDEAGQPLSQRAVPGGTIPSVTRTSV